MSDLSDLSDLSGLSDLLFEDVHDRIDETTLRKDDMVWIGCEVELSGVE